MGEAYNELAMFLENSMAKDKIEMEFVDITQRDLKGYEAADKAIEKGFAIPMTLINGVVKFTGEISRKTIYNEIKKIM
jgi:disulfide oxidoreductase YuzD